MTVSEMWLAGMPSAKRPPNLNVREDHRLFEIAESVGGAMAKRLAVLALSRRTPEDARATLLLWFADLSEIICGSDQREAMGEALECDDDQQHAAMLTWLRAEWSTRTALVELLWRSCLHPTLIYAALSLYDAAGSSISMAKHNGGSMP